MERHIIEMRVLFVNFRT